MARSDGTCVKCATAGVPVARWKGTAADAWKCFACLTDEHVAGVWATDTPDGDADLDALTPGPRQTPLDLTFAGPLVGVDPLGRVVRIHAT
jgi:hypothetical protein